MFTHAEASKNILAFAKDGRLVQKSWHMKKEGRKLACLLGAIHPSVKSPRDCNAELMPLWLAETTVILFDELPEEEVTSVALRYGELIGRWHVMTPEKWDAVLTRFLIICIDEAVEAARPYCEGMYYWPQVVAACKQSCAVVLSRDKEAIRATAEAVTNAAAIVAAEAATNSTFAQVAAGDAVMVAAEATMTYWVARAARTEATIEATVRAVAAANAVAWNTTYHRLFVVLLDEITTEITEQKKDPIHAEASLSILGTRPKQPAKE